MRADAIRNIIDAWDARVVMLQELCETTFLDLRDNELGAGWTARFVVTYVVPMTNDRCRSTGGGSWGIAIFARGAAFSSVTNLLLGEDPEGDEDRRLLCGNTTIGGVGFKVCSSHLTSPNESEPDNQSQFNALRSEINGYATLARPSQSEPTST
ncbi:MAG: hypothetical protein M3423_08775 [Actinomycetota bacterium]|nr:hypothetical protein [Actinomycetota bacterium]